VGPDWYDDDGEFGMFEYAMGLGRSLPVARFTSRLISLPVSVAAFEIACPASRKNFLTPPNI